MKKTENIVISYDEIYEIGINLVKIAEKQRSLIHINRIMSIALDFYKKIKDESLKRVYFYATLNRLNQIKDRITKRSEQ